MPALDAILPAITVAGGVSAAVFTALRFNRDDAGAIVDQQKKIFDSMRELNDEIQESLERTRAERDSLLAKNLEQSKELEVLRAWQREGHAK